jgi:hypothetical protein
MQPPNPAYGLGLPGPAVHERDALRPMVVEGRGESRRSGIAPELDIAAPLRCSQLRTLPRPR